MTFVPSCLHIPYLGVLICRCEQNVRLQFNSQCSLECWADKISDSSSQIILLPHNCSPSSLLARTPRENLFSTIGISSKVKEFFWGIEIGDGPIRGPSEGSQSERLTVNGEIPGLPVITWNYFAGTGSVTSPKSAEFQTSMFKGLSPLLGNMSLGGSVKLLASFHPPLPLAGPEMSDETKQPFLH